MGRRLRFRIDMDDAAADVHLPPMMLLTLVENAIKHGLSALPEGGAIDVRCVLKRGRLTLSVIDDGKGFAGGSGSGTGLANIRARLATLYGAQAELKLASNAPRGVVASLELPALVNAGRSTGP